jgi:hypothetical protein
VLDTIAEKLHGHMVIEEEIFYPAVRGGVSTRKVEEMVPEAYEEHHVVKLVLGEMPEVDVDDERFSAKMTVLEELIEHHVREEEKDLFKAAEKLGKEQLEQLGLEMAERLRAEDSAAGEDGEDEDEPYAEVSQGKPGRGRPA